MSNLEISITGDNIIFAGNDIDAYAQILPELESLYDGTNYSTPINRQALLLLNRIIYLHQIRDNLYYAPITTTNDKYYTPIKTFLDRFTPAIQSYLRDNHADVYLQLLDEVANIPDNDVEDNYKYLSAQFRELIADTEIEEILRNEFYRLYLIYVSELWRPHLRLINSNMRTRTYTVEADTTEDIPAAALIGFIIGYEEIPYYLPTVNRVGDNRYDVILSNND